MKEAAITQSPYVFDPRKMLDPEEREKLYRLRIDETAHPYTVIDVLTKVFRRSFSDDLLSWLGEHPEEFIEFEEGWKLSRAWVNELDVIRSESYFFQDPGEFKVDIAADARIRIEESKKDDGIITRRESLNLRVWLRYVFNFTPCILGCHFVKAVVNEEDSLSVARAKNLPVDKYLLPVMKSEDYARMAELLHEDNYPVSIFCDAKIDPMIWIRQMNWEVKYGEFPENGTLGEYFFGFGTADIIDEKTGSVNNEYIDPGTIILNREMTKSPGIQNSTLAHEATHAFLGRWFFLLQMMHGHDYCSYMCKKKKADEGINTQSPIEIMEMQANTLPRYLLIPDYYGRKHANQLLESYGGERSLANMRRLVDDMAAYYGTTKTMARTRLMDFGYNEVRGILRTANGKLVPAFYSTLAKGEVYCVDEKDALQEYIRNPEFRRILGSGRYLYVRENGCYCLNDSRYLFFDHIGRPHLRGFAREHMSECCLVFREEYENYAVRLINGILQKGNGRGKKKIQYVGANGESAVTQEGLDLRKKIEKQMAETAAVKMDFCGMTVKLMERKRVSIEMLAERTGLSVETIKRMRTRTDFQFSIQYVIAVCIGLHLSPETSEEYISVSPAKFLNTVDMRLYQYTLMQWYNEDVAVVNRRLVEAGAEPLTNLVDGYDENGARIAN